MSYNSNTLIVNGTSTIGNPTSGISLGPINIGQTIPVKFKATVNGPADSTSRYINSVKIDYSFDILNDTITPGTIDTVNRSNITTNVIYSSDISIIPTMTISDKSSNSIQHVAAVGDTVQYTIAVRNTSSSESITSVTLKDSLPTELSYVDGTLTIDDAESTEPITNINLNTIAPNTTATVKFTATVNSNPTGGNKYTNSAAVSYIFQSRDSTDLSNTVSATNTVYSDSIVVTPTITISANPTVVNINNVVTYSIIITNTTSTIIENPILTNILPSGLSYESDSLTVNGTQSKDSLVTGVNLPNINLNNPVTVKFKANVVNTPSVGIEYVNTITLSYDFNSVAGTLSNKVSTNNTIHSDAIIIKPQILLSSNKRSVIIGDFVKYTLSITNNNNINIENPIVTFKISDGLSFVPNSLIINDSNLLDSIENDIPLANIPENKTSTIIFETKVTSSPPSGIQYLTFATIKYNFQGPGGQLTNILNSNDNIIFINSTIINPISFKNIYYTTLKNNPLIQNIDVLNITNTPLTYSLNTYPLNGYSSISKNGILRYAPKVDFIGQDTFSLLLSNKKLGSITSTITILVNNGNDFKYTLC
ncbi:conserved repeat domain protein [Clostridium botulinum C str. Eklund]|nr:conserved repeat domain protein [Clostridium botulinum C str. Eklund]NEZ48850.1 DUF11 domain-containing protein [Clostridium botulinum]